jgi:hypothetical protein
MSMVPGIVDVRTDLAWTTDDSQDELRPLDVVVPMGPR